MDSWYCFLVICHVNIKLVLLFIAWHIRHKSKKVFSCVWWFYCCFGVKIQPYHFFCFKLNDVNSSCMLAFVLRAQLIDGQVKRYHAKSILRNFIQYTKEHLFSKQKPATRTKHIGQVYRFPYFNHFESWAAVLTSVSVIAMSLMLGWRLECTNREMIGMHHYHYHPCSNPVCSLWQHYNFRVPWLRYLLLVWPWVVESSFVVLMLIW